MQEQSWRGAVVPALFLAVVIWGCGGSTSGGSSPPPSPPPPPSNISVSVSPPSTTLDTAGSQQFTATVTGTSNTAVNWNVNGVLGGNATVGTITSSGLYTAPATVPSPPTVTVTAVSQADPSKSDSADVRIVKPGTGAENQARQALPVELGTSGGNAKDSTTTARTITCCSGTLGALAMRGGTAFILSNNHVLARRDQAVAGEDITQPGLTDSQCNANSAQVVAHFSQATPLRTSNVDAAIAGIVAGAVDTSGGILEFAPDGVKAAPPAASAAAATLSMPVAKSGRSTGLTCSAISAIHTTVVVDYQTNCGTGDKFPVTFTNQIVVNDANFSASGDSGSLIVNSQTSQPVGLLFAGSTTDTVANPIQDVLAALSAGGDAVTLVGGPQHPIACPAGGTAATQVAAVAGARLAIATATRDKYANSLMADPAVLGVEAGASDDDPGQAALVIYLQRRKQHAPIPAQLDGVRTKLIFTERSGAAEAQATALEPASQMLLEEEISRAAQIKEKHAQQLMARQGVFGVGVGASKDSPGEAAIVLYVERSMPAEAIPAEIEDVRTRVARTDHFRAFGWNEKAPQACRLKPGPVRRARASRIP